MHALRIHRGALLFEDRARPTPFRAELADLDVVLDDFTTRRDREGYYSFHATTTHGEALYLEGDISAVPPRSHGTLTLRGIRAHTLWSYVQDQLAFEVTRGNLGVTGSYRLDLSGGEPQFVIEEARVAVSDLALVDRASGAEILALPLFALSGLSLDLATQQLDIARLHSEGLVLRATRAADGTLDLLRVFTPLPAGTDVAAAEGESRESTEAPAAASGDPSSSPAWSLRVEEIALAGYDLALADQVTEPAAALALAPLDLELTHLAPGTSEPARLALRATVNGAGEASIDGGLTLEPLAASLDLQLTGVDLTPLQPYLNAFARLDLLSGKASASGHAELALDGGQPRIRFTGDAAVAGLRARDRLLEEDLVRWELLALNGVDYASAPAALGIREILAREPYARLIIAPDASTNIGDVVVAQAEAPGGPHANAEPLAIAIGTLRVVDGSMNFADQTLTPHFATGIQQLAGHPLGASLEELLGSGITTLACIYNARQLGQEAALTAAKIQMQAIGADLVNVIDQGYQAMTF